MLFRAPRHFYTRTSIHDEHSTCVNALPSSTSFLHYNRLLKEYERMSVSMLFRAPRHFYPTLSETLDLQGFLRPFLQVFFRIFWQIAFFRVFLCLGDFFIYFKLFWTFFIFYLNSDFLRFSFFSALFPSSTIIISYPDNVKQRFPVGCIILM